MRLHLTGFLSATLILALTACTPTSPSTPTPGSSASPVASASPTTQTVSGTLNYDQLIRIYTCASAQSGPASSAYLTLLNTLKGLQGTAATLNLQGWQPGAQATIAATGCQPDGSTIPVAGASAGVSSPDRVEAETAQKTAGQTKFPEPERRGNTAVVMMFSGGDAGAAASLSLPALQGRYRIVAHALNHGDSPALQIQLGSLNLELPAGATQNSGGDLTDIDLGEHTLNLSAGSALTMTVGGNKTGQTNAWIGVDYFSFEPVN